MAIAISGYTLSAPRGRAIASLRPVGEGRLPANETVQLSQVGSWLDRPRAQFPDIEAFRGLCSIAVPSMASGGVDPIGST
jgi:hypothetical protein